MLAHFEVSMDTGTTGMDDTLNKEFNTDDHEESVINHIDNLTSGIRS